MTKGKFYVTLLITSVVMLIAWGVSRCIAVGKFEVEVEGYFENYVEAGTVETARENLDMAIQVLEAKGLTEGQISIFWKNPNNDIGLWYHNLVESRNALKEIAKESPKDQAIVLEKQRNGLKGSEENSFIKTPSGISIYPMNKAYFWWCMLSIVACIVFLIRIGVLVDNCEMTDPLFPEKDNKATAGA